MSWFLRLLPGSVIYRRTHRTQGIVVLTANSFMIYYRERMQSKISKGKVYGLKAWLTLVQAFKSPFPVESPRACLSPPATSNTCELLPS